MKNLIHNNMGPVKLGMFVDPNVSSNIKKNKQYKCFL